MKFIIVLDFADPYEVHAVALCHIKQYIFSKYSQQTPHSSQASARYGLPFVKKKTTSYNYSTSVTAVLYTISCYTSLRCIEPNLFTKLSWFQCVNNAQCSAIISLSQINIMPAAALVLFAPVHQQTRCWLRAVGKSSATFPSFLTVYTTSHISNSCPQRSHFSKTPKKNQYHASEPCCVTSIPSQQHWFQKLNPCHA